MSRSGWMCALAAFVAALTCYQLTGLLAGRDVNKSNAYFNLLADAFAHGRLHLIDPPNVRDLTPHEGRWYVGFLPLPALVLLPAVALFGVERVQVLPFSTVCGAASVALVALLLDALARRGWTRLGPAGNLWLCALLAFGTVHWYAAADASVWYLSQTYTVFVVALAAWLAAAFRSPWAAGVALAAVLWTRPHVVLVWPLLAGLAAQRMRDDLRAGGDAGPRAGSRAGGDPLALDRGRFKSWCLRSLVPLAVSAAGLMLYNFGRFGDPLDFGYTRQNVNVAVAGDLHQRGQFHPAFVPRNLHALLLALPTWPKDSAWPRPDAHGMSLLLTTPALLYLVRARRGWAEERARRPPGGAGRGTSGVKRPPPAPDWPSLMVRGAWCAVGLILVPLLLYYNTGWTQFGYRFSLDFTVPMIVLLAVAAGRRVTAGLAGLILLSVAVNAWGTHWWFTRFR